VLGDLDEEFAAMAQTDGVRAARRWYWRQLLSSAGPLGRLRLASARRALRRVELSPAGAAADAWQGARWLVRHPALSATAVATLALALAAALAGFSVMHAVLLRPLPFADASRIVIVEATGPQRPAGARAVSLLDVEDWRLRAQAFDAISAYTPEAFRLTGRGDPREIDGLRVGPDFERVLGIRPAIGRAFEGPDFTPGASEAILAHEFWQREFGGDPLPSDGRCC
jgi:hypothetical protein